MDSQPNLIDLNTELSCEPIAAQNNDIDHQYVNCNGSESITCLDDKEDTESTTYSIFGAACLSSLSNNNSYATANKDPFDMRMYSIYRPLPFIFANAHSRTYVSHT